MLGLRLWLRRCTAAKAFPALIGVGIAMVAGRHGWEHDWRWALDWAGFATFLTGPALAGLVAYDRSRLVEPTLAEMGKSSPRAARGMFALLVASWLWSVLAWGIVLLYAGWRVHQSGGVAQPDPWSLLIPPVVLLACGSLGLAIGSVARTLAAGPVATLVCYFVALTPMMSSLGLPSILVVDPSAGTRIGLERDPTASMTTIGIQLVLVGACLLWSMRSVALTNRLRRAGGLILGISTVIALLGLGSIGHRVDEWRDAGRPTECLGQVVVVCGPVEAHPMLQGARSSMEAAMATLAMSGVNWQRKYVFAHSVDVPADSGKLSMQPEGMVGNALSIDDIASTLMTPRVCAAYFSSQPPMALMTSQGLVREWTSGQLAAPGPARRAPAAVIQAYQRLRSCEPASAPSRTQAPR